MTSSWDDIRPKIRYATDEDDKKDYITYSELEVLLSLDRNKMKRIFARLKIYAKLKGTSQKHYFFKKDINIKKIKEASIEDKELLYYPEGHFCLHCNVKFDPTVDNTPSKEFCSYNCKKMYRKVNSDKAKAKNAIIKKNMEKYEDKFAPSMQEEIRKDHVNILTCSVECMIDELGDLE